MKRAKVLAIVGVAAGSLSAQATILTFDIDGIGNHGAVSDNYGDNVNGPQQGNFHYGVGPEGYTPTVSVEYGPASAQPAWWNTGYGDLTNVLFEDNDNFGQLEIAIFAGGGNVTLYDFDMAAFTSAFGSDPIINEVRIRDYFTGFTRYLSTNQVISRTGHTHFDFGSNMVGGGFIISFNTANLGGLSDDIAIDNIRFGWAVLPEPGTMIAVGLGAALLVRRRKR